MGSNLLLSFLAGVLVGFIIIFAFVKLAPDSAKYTLFEIMDIEIQVSYE